MFAKPTVLAAIALVTAAVVVAVLFSDRDSPQQAVRGGTEETRAPIAAPAPTKAPDVGGAADFPAVSKLINDAVAAHRFPGAVVMIGHAGKTVLHQAYGMRKLPGEPGLNGAPAPAEAMTEDTIFDLASLTKPLATATAVMQLYEQGKVQFDDPVQKYLPGFNPAGDPLRAQVTLRMLLTHTSGEPGDVDLKDPWGLQRVNKSEGMRRALATPLQTRPGQGFRYSDVNYILLGALIEKLTGEAEDVYVHRNIFAPLGMAEARYLPQAKACGPHQTIGAATTWARGQQQGGQSDCPAGTWSTALLRRIAPTARDEENGHDPGRNPNFFNLLRGTVHDTTTRRMGGVAGHAGVFSTARDVGIYAQALLDRLAGRPSKFPLKQETLQLMTAPQQPGHSAQQVEAANDAARKALAATPNRPNPLLAPSYPAIWGQNLRGFGWDIDSIQSVPRGVVFPIGSFGHTGFTGTSIWIDPGSDTYVIVLTNSIQVRGSTPISDLRGEVATLAARELDLYRTAIPATTPSAPSEPPG